MQTFEIPHLWTHSSGSAITWDVFRGRWHRTVFSGISLWWGVLSRSGWGWACVGCLYSSIIRRTCCRLFLLRYFDFLENFYSQKVFCHKAAGRKILPGPWFVVLDKQVWTLTSWLPSFSDAVSSTSTSEIQREGVAQKQYVLDYFKSSRL